jgi:hypothetical protein
LAVNQIVSAAAPSASAAASGSLTFLTAGRTSVGRPSPNTLQDNSGRGTAMSENTETAIVAGGCFWPAQELLRRCDGVISTRVGYTGGENDDPTAENHPGHAEAVEVVFDRERTSYREILEFFFQIHRPDLGEEQHRLLAGLGPRADGRSTKDSSRCRLLRAPGSRSRRLSGIRGGVQGPRDRGRARS